MSTSSIDLNSQKETAALAARLAEHLQAGDVIGLEGPLGAGKTFFAREAIYGLGVGREISVTSPTFALVQEYQGRLPIVHADLYRLDRAAELWDLGLEELLAGEHVVFFEWAERFASALPEITAWLQFKVISEEARRARWLPLSERGQALGEALGLA